MMGVAEVDPQAERLGGRHPIEKFRGLGGGRGIRAGAYIVEALLKGAEAVLFQQLAESGATPLAGAVEVIAASADADIIAGLLAQDFGKCQLVLGQRRGEAGDAGRDRRASGHERGARRHTLRRGGEEAVELHAIRRQFVQHRRSDIRVAVATQEWITMVIGEQEQDVRPLGGGCKTGAQSGKHEGNESYTNAISMNHRRAGLMAR